jgi:glycerol-3-phosphate dehydrogenase (NAD(P)+)
MEKQKIGIIGHGGWGTALAILLDRVGHETMVWGFEPDYIEEIKRTRQNHKFLPKVRLSKSIQWTSAIEEAAVFGSVVIFAIPTQYLRNVLYGMRLIPLGTRLVVSVAKGVEQKTLYRPSEVIESVLGKQKLVVLSGPSHAEEVANAVPSCVVAAARNINWAREAQNIFSDSSFRIYTSQDVIGVEVGGAVKNVVAIAAGVCEGLGYGTNSKAALLSRGIIEITHLGVKMGANPNTFIGLSGIGDLITTCFSEYGRNRAVGKAIGEGKKLDEVLEGMEMVAEGVETTRSTMELAEKYHVDMPIVKEVHRILFEEKNPRRAVEDLMGRALKSEMEFSYSR